MFHKQKIRKRTSDTRYTNSYLVDALVKTLKKKLESDVRQDIEKGKSIFELKKELLQKKKLLRDVIPDVESEYDILSSTITGMLTIRLKGTAYVSHWIKVVNKNFDSAAANIKKESSGQLSSSHSEHQSKPSTSKAETQVQRSTSQSTSSVNASLSTKNVRTCTVSIRSILKQNNVEQEVQELFCKTLKEKVKVSSVYLSRMGLGRQDKTRQGTRRSTAIIQDMAGLDWKI